MYLDRAYTAIINYSISSFTHVFRPGIHNDLLLAYTTIINYPVLLLVQMF